MIDVTSSPNFPDRETLLSMSGLEFMQAVKLGTMPPPPISRILNFILSDVSDGQTIFSGTPKSEHCNPTGGLHGGWYGTVLDSCMACAVMTKVPRGSIYTTLEYKINIVRSIPIGVKVRARGWIQHVGRSTGVAAGEIRGFEDDKVYATGSTTCIIMKMSKSS